MEDDDVSASPRGIKRKADDVPLTVTAPRRIQVKLPNMWRLNSYMQSETR
jgi:hypothetical protein